MNELLVIVPTRGRPENVQRLLDNWGNSPDLLFGLDDDDPTNRDSLMRVFDWDQSNPASVWAEIHPRLRMGPTLNLLATKFASQYPYLGFMGDDHLPSGDWAYRIVYELKRLGSGIVYGNDLWQRENLPTAVFMTSNIVETLGYMCPPAQQHLYLDDAWLSWGRGMGRLSYLDDVIIEHLHPDAGKASRDDSYNETNSGGQYSRDLAAYEVYKQTQLPDDVAKLRKLP